MTVTTTALQRHVGFFDPAGTGIVTLAQTAAGMRRLGIPLVWRIVLPPIIQLFVGYLTQGHLSVVIRVDRIARAKHPFDTGGFDATGEVDPGAFDVLFASAQGDALSADEMCAVITARGNRLPAMGKVAGYLGHWFSRREVDLLFCIACDTTKSVGKRTVKAVSKQALRTFYDGTLLHDIARRRALVAAGCVLKRQGA
jgi:hypothetical protein